MGGISGLSYKDTITSATTFAVSVNGRDYQALASDVLTYIEGSITYPGQMVTQYSAPSATGFTATITDDSDSVWLILTPVAGYAAGTITLPSTGNSAHGQEVLVNCTQAVTTLTVDGNGSTVTGEPATLAANDFFRLRFDSVTSTWYRVG